MCDPMVVLEKFCPQLPFEISVADGDVVFGVLDRVGAQEPLELDGARAKLHDMEGQSSGSRADVGSIASRARTAGGFVLPLGWTLDALATGTLVLIGKIALDTIGRPVITGT